MSAIFMTGTRSHGRELLLTRYDSVCFKLKSSFRKFYVYYHDLVNGLGIYVSQMTTDMFRLS